MANISGGSVVWDLDIDDSKFKSKLRSASQEMTDGADKTEKASSKSWLKMGAVMGAVAGAAQAAFSRAMDAISNSVTDAVKRVDILNNFPKIMSNMNISADESKKVIDDLSKRLQGLPTPLDTAALAVQRLTASTGDVKRSEEVFLALNNAILAGGAPMDLQASAMEQFSQSFAKGKPDMMEWRSLMSAMPAQLKQVADAMGQPNVDALGEALRNGDISMKDFSDTLVNLNKNGTGNFQSFEQQAKNSTNGIQTGFANMQTSITRGLAKIFNTIGQENISKTVVTIGKAFETGLTFVAGFITFLQNNEWALYAFGGALTGIAIALAVAVAPAVWGAVTAFGALVLAAAPFILIGAAIGLVAFAIVKNWETVKNFFLGIWDWIKTNWPLLLVILLGPIGLAAVAIIKNFDTIKDVFIGAFNWVKQNWPLLLAIITGPIGLAVLAVVKNFDTIKSAAQAVWNWIKGAFGTIGEIGTSIIKGAVNSVLGFAENTVNGFINLINSALNAINKIPGVNIGKINTLHIPRLAEGGIVPATQGGRLALIGEGGQDEAVIPLSKLRDMNIGNGSSEANITINLSGIMARSRTDLRDIGVELIEAVNEGLRAKNLPQIGGGKILEVATNG